MEAAKEVVGKDGAPIVDKRWGNLSTKCGLTGRGYARRAQVATIRAMGLFVSSTISTV